LLRLRGMMLGVLGNAKENNDSETVRTDVRLPEHQKDLVELFSNPIGEIFS
jgi:hypothetical protein